jgi:hypothetical protein
MPCRQGIVSVRPATTNGLFDSYVNNRLSADGRISAAIGKYVPISAIDKPILLAQKQSL